ncbi:hypothetical protein [Thiopseudomonas alkaliphila]|uniref:hypothetical protein n=1 Tax=Thiopseudomonas alkaliphila TaxID=1697053 RepID=UPI002574D68B|nr:hypothetical protein [Thiopseudomonas alkaliphila]MDM1717326.1 hypothetical protein [Thiopseudomonas alkaliphila]
MVIIKSFLHFAPTYIVRMCSFDSEYSINSVWPEVLLCADKETADQLRRHLLSAFSKAGAKCPNQKVQPICIYRIQEFNDDDFYDYVHRVPMSIKNLQQLEEKTGYAIKETISYV